MSLIRFSTMARPTRTTIFISSSRMTWDLEVLGGLLMSAVGQFFVESYGVRMRGGYCDFRRNICAGFAYPIPRRLVNELRRRYWQKRSVNVIERKCTRVALEVYGIEKHEMERALGH